MTTRAAAQPLAPAVVTDLVRSYPSIARTSPPCLALEERVAGLAGTLDVPFGDASAAFATHALNHAAALASECQRPKEVNRILRQHLTVYADQDELSVAAAIAMLEPATDLARLYALAGRTDLALSWLLRLMHAVRTGTSTSIDRYTLPLDRVAAEPGEDQLLQGWARTRLLADGVKILAMAGRWGEAAELVARHDGMSVRLTEVRQVVIVAYLVDGNLAAARGHLERARPTQEWEHEVASCLGVLVAEPADRAEAAETMITVFQRSAPTADLAAYRARYGIAVTRLAQATGHPYAAIARQLAAEAIAMGDGHAARDLLRHVGGCLSHKDIGTLERNVTRSGLRPGALSGYNLSRLRTTTERATTILQTTLRRTPR